MERLSFDRFKYDRQLLIDATNEEQLSIENDYLILNFYTLIFFKAGSGIFRQGSNLIEVTENTVLFIPPGVLNKVDEVNFERCTLLFFERDFLDVFFNDIHFIYRLGVFHNQQSPPYVRLPTPDFGKLYSVANDMLSEIQNLQEDSEHMLRSALYGLLMKLQRAYRLEYGFSPYLESDPRILGFLHLLENRDWSRGASVDECAAAVGISRVQLNNLCKKVFAKTASEVIQERLLLAIQREMLYGRMQFGEMAYAFGFSAPSHFSRFIKRMTGHSPRELKKNLSKR